MKGKHQWGLCGNGLVDGISEGWWFDGGAGEFMDEPSATGVPISFADQQSNI